MSFANFAAFFALLALTANLRVLMRCFDTLRWDEAFAACTDEILTVCLAQSLANQIEILRAAELEKRTLHGFFFRRTGNVDRLAASRVYTGVEPVSYTHLTQLAQSLLNWCALIERTDDNPYAYAGATMALLCMELRRTLLRTA